jgi:predicted DNA-binding transcriptional regulator AlpA
MGISEKQMNVNTPEPYWNDFAVARFFSIHASKVRRWRREDKGPKWVRIGGAVRYKPADVFAWAEAQTPEKRPRSNKKETDTEPPEDGAAPVEYSAG